MSKIGSFFGSVIKPFKTVAHGIEGAVKDVGKIAKDVATGDVKSLGKDAISLASRPAKTSLNVAKDNLGTVGKTFEGVKDVAKKGLKYSPAGAFFEKTSIGKKIWAAKSKVGNGLFNGLKTVVKKATPAGLLVGAAQKGKLGGLGKTVGDGVGGLVDSTIGKPLKTALGSKSFSESTLAAGEIALTVVPGVGAAGAAANAASAINTFRTVGQGASEVSKLADGIAGAGKASKALTAAKNDSLIGGPQTERLLSDGAASKAAAFNVPSPPNQNQSPARYLDDVDLGSLNYM